MCDVCRPETRRQTNTLRPCVIHFPPEGCMTSRNAFQLPLAPCKYALTPRFSPADSFNSLLCDSLLNHTHTRARALTPAHFQPYTLWHTHLHTHTHLRTHTLLRTRTHTLAHAYDMWQHVLQYSTHTPITHRHCARTRTHSPRRHGIPL